MIANVELNNLISKLRVLKLSLTEPHMFLWRYLSMLIRWIHILMFLGYLIFKLHYVNSTVCSVERCKTVLLGKFWVDCCKLPYNLSNLI
jgi:hypothetical protein